MFRYVDYKKLLNEIKDCGYQWKFFSDSPKSRKNIYLRHDIDIDIDGAIKLGKVEEECGFRSTWFFMPNNELYNPLSRRGLSILRALVDQGHEVGLHIDPGGLASLDELTSYVESMFNFLSNELPITRVFSWHRPTSFGIEMNGQVERFVNAYDDQFFRNIRYFSDSNRREFATDEFYSAVRRKESMQLLTHPIWWNERELDPEKVKEQLGDSAMKQLNRALNDNITLYSTAP